MRTLLMLILMSARPCLAQEIPPGPQQSLTDPQPQVPAGQPDAPQPDPTITVPEGTRIQLALANPIIRRTAQIGDAVRAVTTFPVTMGQDLAIPQGTFFEGRVVRVRKHGSTRFDGLVIDFKQVIFSNGYNAALDGSVVDAKNIPPATDSIRTTAAPGLIANGFPQQPTPTPPPLPQVGPSKALVIGVGTAAMVGIMATVAILGRRHGRDQGRDFDIGFQFEIALKAPLTLDRARVAAALSSAGAN